MKYLAVILLAASLTGCALFKGVTNSGPSVYEAGYAVVEFDMITKPFQLTEVREIVNTLYLIAQGHLEAGTLTDEIMRDAIARAFEGRPPEEMQAILSLYIVAKNRLLRQIDIHPDLSRLELLNEFFRGINAARAVYYPNAVKEAEIAELLKATGG